MADPLSIGKNKLSGSTDGRGILIAAVATAGTLLHTARSGTAENEFDEIWLWVVNSDTVAKKLTIEFGGTTAPNDLIEVTIPPESGLYPVIPGLILQNACVVRAFAATTNLLVAYGYVNRLAP